MIELVFSESPAGALKLAKSMKQGEHLGGPAAIFGGTKEEQQAASKACIWTGMNMEGNSMDVVGLALVLDIGDISDMDIGMNAGIDTGINGRKKILDNLFADFPGMSDQMWKTNQHAINKILKAKSTLEPIRLWISTCDPAEMCGLYFMCHFMSDSQTPLLVVRVPMEIEKDNSLISYRSTGEIPAEEFGAFTQYEETISQCQRSAYADNWSDLVHENAPLRAVINGKLIGVPAGFYDFALRANMPDGELRVGQLISKAITQMPGIGDRWLFLRIQAMLQSGELIEVSAATDHSYSRVIKRSSKRFC